MHTGERRERGAIPTPLRWGIATMRGISQRQKLKINLSVGTKQNQDPIQTNILQRIHGLILAQRISLLHQACG